MAKSYIPHYQPAEDKAVELCEGLKTQQEKYNAVTAWLVKCVVYDYVRATKFRELHGPDVERCYDLRMGICLDISALTACMLRAVGIEANVVIGNCTSVYTSGGHEYRGRTIRHAWNEIFIGKKRIIWDQMIEQKNRNAGGKWSAIYKQSYVRK